MSVRRSAALLLVAPLLLAGCQDEPEPQFEPTPTESSSPTDPESSEQPVAQTAEEFIDEWFRLGTEMQNTGETAPFRSVSRGCEPCDSFADDVERVYAAGGFIRIDAERVIYTELLPGRPGNRPEYLVRVRSTPTTYKEGESSEQGSFPGGVNTYELTLALRSGEWVTANYLDRS